MSRRPLSGFMLLLFVSLAGAHGARSQSADAMQMNKPPAVPSTSLTLTVGEKKTVFTLAELKAMPHNTFTVHNEHTKAEESYSGVLLSDLLAKCGFVADKPTQRKMLRSYIAAEGTDKYRVLFSATEVEGSEHRAEVLVVTTMDGKDLGQDGHIKLIDTADKKPERWVRNLSSITLTTVP